MAGYGYYTIGVDVTNTGAWIRSNTTPIILTSHTLNVNKQTPYVLQTIR
jgi:hypothetical protein